MQIQPIINNNTGFRGTFVKNKAWKNIEKHYNQYGKTVIDDFKPYIKLIEQHCPESSVYQFIEKEEYTKDRGFYNIYTLLRNNNEIGKSYNIRLISYIFDAAKPVIVKDAVGDIK